MTIVVLYILLMRTSRRIIAIMSRSSGQSPTSVPRKNQRESLDSLIDDAISSPLDLGSSFGRSSIPAPPQAHYPSSMTGLGRPRLVSQLTRSTLPTASLAYASDGARVSSTDIPNQGESSKHRRNVSATIDAYPDLNPATGLPVGAEEEDPRLHLQRTITGLSTMRKYISGSNMNC